MADQKVVTMRRWGHDPRRMIQVTLTYDGIESWLVSYEGETLGSVRSFEGTRDRPVGGRHSNIVKRGKRRKLWACSGLPFTSFDSRAEAIRQLLSLHGVTDV